MTEIVHFNTFKALADANAPQPEELREPDRVTLPILTLAEAQAVRDVLGRLLEDDYAAAATLSRAHRIALIAAHAKINLD